MRLTAALGFAAIGLVAGVDGALPKCQQGKVGNVIQMKLERKKDGESTPLGDLHLGLFNEDLPKTSENLEWACQNHFKGSPFHRVIPQFMAQGGDFTNRNGTGGKSKWGPKFNDEAFVFGHGPYCLSMANSGRNTNGSQFFVTFTETPWLDGKHVVFGCATKGKDTLTALEAYGSQSGKTNGEIIISSCRVVGADEATKCLSPETTKHGDL